MEEKLEAKLSSFWEEGEGDRNTIITHFKEISARCKERWQRCCYLCPQSYFIAEIWSNRHRVTSTRLDWDNKTACEFSCNNQGLFTGTHPLNLLLMADNHSYQPSHQVVRCIVRHLPHSWLALILFNFPFFITTYQQMQITSWKLIDKVGINHEGSTAHCDFCIIH